VLSVLAPMWKDKSDAASRLRAKIERVLDAAKAKGLRTGENPARWRGHLNKLLPKPQKLTRGHMRALPYSDVPAFVSDLRKRQIATALALEFCILNASRAGEVFGAKWSEIDREARLWIIPGRRMKGGREHRVPLSARSLEILETAESMRNSEYVFPGEKRGRPLSPASIRSLISRMSVATSVHGFRSSFRDWAGECTAFPRELAEAALAHLVGDQTERAYRRGDALEKRRKLMDAWAGFLAAPKASGKVVPLNARNAG
jgi:integrase